MRFLSQRVRACGLLLLGVLTATSVISVGSQGLALENADVHVNTSTAGSQDSAAIARDADGDFVVVWAGNGTELLQTDTAGVFLQRYDRNGVAQGGETRANTTTTGIQRNPAVAMDASGNFVVVWETCDAGGTGCDVVMQRYSSAGVTQGNETTVNATTADEQTSPAVARAAGGSFVVAWQSLNQDGSGQGIYAQRFNADGTTAGSEFVVNATTAFSQVDPAIAIDVGGSFVIAWTSGDGAGQLNGTFARRFAADGTPGSEFRANVTTAGDQLYPSVSMSAAGAFVIAWQGPDADGTGVFMRRYDSSGTALAVADEPVNATTTGNQGAPSIAVDAGGDIVVAWHGVDADPFGIFFRRFNASGVAQGSETAANVTTAGDQASPAAAADADGDFVVAWESFNQTPDIGTYGIFLRRFSGPEDVDLSVNKTDSADPVSNGAPYSYTLTVENRHAAASGSGDTMVDAAIGSATGITVTDILPAGVGFVSGTATGWTCADASGTVTCTYANTLAPGATTSVTLNVTAPAGGGRIDNTATVSGGQYDSATANDSESEITYACAAGGANAGTLQFSGATFAVGEDGDDAGGNDDGLATITVTRTGGSCGTASVEVTSSNGSAISGADYTGLAAPVTLNWADGDAAAKTFTIAIAEDTAHEIDTESFNLALGNPDRATLGSQGTAAVNITDNDTPPTVTMSATGSPFSENGGTATVTATLSKPAGRTVQVNLAYAAGPGAEATGAANRGTGCGTTATTPSDYSCSATSITINAGSSSGSVTLTGVDDTRDEDDTEAAAITVTCRTPGGQSDADCTPNGAAPQISPQVQDDDAFPSVQFSAASASVSEAQDPLNLPSQNRTAAITLQLSAASDRTVAVAFDDVVGETASKGTDFSLSPNSPGSFTFAPGQTAKTITATIIHDTVDEPNETIIVGLSAPTNATIGTNGVHTLTITDDEATPTVQWNPNTANATEGTTTQITATAVLSGTSSQNVTVPFTVGGTAVNPEDHNAQAGSITITAGNTTGTYTYNIVDDALHEADETAVLTIGTPTGATAGANATHTTTIAANDPQPTVQIDSANSAVTASEAAGTASIVVSLTPVSGRAASVAYTITGSAGNGSDYTLSPASPLSFAAGETSKTVTVTLINDPNNETNSETLILTLNNPGNATLGTPASHTLTITDDDDMPQVHFSAAAQSAAEGAGSVAATLQLSRATNVDVTVPFTTGGSASANDYTLSCPDGAGGTQPCAGEVVIPAGQTSADIGVNIAADARVEANETLALTIGTPVNATKDAPSTHTLTINNDDTAGVTVNPLTADVNEGGGGDSYTLVLTSQPSNDVTISASVGTQAAVSPGAVTFTSSDWNTPKTITVVAVNDSVQEGPHGDTITHSAGSMDLDYQGIAVADVAVSVTDNDVPAIVLTESNGSTDVTEGGATDTYSFVLTTQPSADVVITVTPSSQVLRSPATVTFTPANWDTPQNVTITADNDSVAEGGHAGTVSHSVASGDVAYNGMAVRMVNVQIADNDTAGVTVTPSGGSTAVTEGGATDTYTVVLTSEPTADVTITLNPGSQLSGNPTSLTFTAVNWNLGRIVTVTAVDDNVAEGTHNGTITHSATSADPKYSGIAVASVGATITDNDTAGLTVIESAGATAVVEGGATDTFTVRLSSQPTASVTVTLSPGTQLGVSPATLNFTTANYATPQTVTVTAVDDNRFEGDHAGTVSASSSSTDANYAGKSATIAVTIGDNDTVSAGEQAPAVVVTQTGGSVNVSTSGGGAFSWTGLIGLIGLLALRRRRHFAALAALLGLVSASASARDLSYSYGDLRYVTASVDQPSVDASGYGLAGSWLINKQFFVTGSYGSSETDEFELQGAVGTTQSDTFALGLGLRRPLRPGLELNGVVSVVSSKAEGNGDFAGSADDTGFGLDGGLRQKVNEAFEWGVGVSYVSIFDNDSTALNAQGLYFFSPAFAGVFGAGFGDNSTQFNLGLRFSLARAGATK